MRRLMVVGAFLGTVFATIRMPLVTYYRDVLPILQEHCLVCHRPGQIGPMSFVTYRETRPWAEAIKHVVVTGRMPLWSGGFPASFGQDHSLSKNDVETIVQWVEGGAPAGDPKDTPPVYPEEATRANTPRSTAP